MDRAKIVDLLQAHRADLQARGVAHLALFGSRMRGDERSDSDLDVLVDIAPEHEPLSLIGIARVGNLITDITGIEAVAIERKMLSRRPELMSRIAGDIVEVF